MTFQQATHGFERAVHHLRDQLQYLVDQDKVSPRFVKGQNLVLKSLIDYQKCVEQLMDELQNEVHHLALSKHHEYKQLRDRYEGLEAICLLHGILDYRLWLNRGRRQLVAETVDYHRNHYLQLPYQFMELIHKLSKEDKDLFFELLQKGRKQPNGTRTQGN